MNYAESEIEDTLTAYHEAGHAVVAYLLGGHVESVCLGDQVDQELPARFGDCRVNWGPIDPHSDWQRQREVLTLLAGPLAEMIHLGQRHRMNEYPPAHLDWALALRIGRSLVPGDQRPLDWLRCLEDRLEQWLRADWCWSAIAAVADELAAHELLEFDQLAETIGFWMRHSS